MTSRGCLNERRRRSVLFIAVSLPLFLSGCDGSDVLPEADIDRQTCLNARLAPSKALSACTRFIDAEMEPGLTSAEGYYNRGMAFAELGEFRHAKLDFEDALKLDPQNHWARERLDDVEEHLRAEK